MAGDGNTVASNTPDPQGVGQGAAQPASDASVAQQVSVTPSDATQGAGVGTPTEANDEVRRFQSIADQRLAENYRLQQELQQLRSQVNAVDQRTMQQERNPYNPETDGINYWRYEQAKLAKDAAMETRKQLAEEFQIYARQQQEMDWQRNHPDVDINTVKMFMQQRGISNPDDAYSLMTMGNRMQSVASNASQNTFNNLVKPQNGAQPIRATSGAQQPQYEFRKLLEAYNQNPGIENTWEQGLKDAFWREINAIRTNG